MNNTEKKLDALIDALGFDVECIRHIYVNGVRHCGDVSTIPATPMDDIQYDINYKFNKRKNLTGGDLAKVLDVNMGLMRTAWEATNE